MGRFNLTQRKKVFGLLMILPATIVIMLISIYPLLSGISMGFTDYSMFNLKTAKFVGFKNFIDIFNSNRQFYNAVAFTFLNSVVVVAGSYVVGFFLAVLLNNEIRMRGLIRALILIPWVIPPVIAAVCWQWSLTDGGIVNKILMGLSIVDKPVMFLSKVNSARITAFAMGVWKNFPFMTLVLLAGMQGIPKELYNAAYIDGAGKVKAFIHITVPMLRYLSITSSVLMFIWTFNNFENIFLLTKGGPAESTTILPILSYNIAFYRGKLGYAAALAVIMLILLTLFVLIYMNLLNKDGKSNRAGNKEKQKKGGRI